MFLQENREAPHCIIILAASLKLRIDVNDY
jgi:hypothetical protein